MLYKTILADVPLATNQRTDGAREAEQHYQTMSVEELCQLTIPADDPSLLLFWAWNSRLPECLQIVEKWGFQYRTCITWIKPHMGIGNYVRNASEHIFLATRGRNAITPAPRHISWFIAETRGHSRKPEMQYDIAEVLGKPPYLELFARRPRPNWDSWGNELGTTLTPKRLEAAECQVLEQENSTMAGSVQ